MVKLNEKHSGYVAIIGRPNVGKSTLLNRIVGQKLSITSRKAQTTRQQIFGIKTTKDTQFVFIDTPGFQKKHKSALNRYMNRQATMLFRDVDVIVFMIDHLILHDEDKQLLAELKSSPIPIILVINKIDAIKNKLQLLPFLERLKVEFPFREMIPISAKTRENIDRLEFVIVNYLPEQPFIFNEDEITNRSQAFFASEIIREKVIRFLGEELPYHSTVLIESFKEEAKFIQIHALIVVQTNGQKKIVIGEGGEKIKQIGTQARLDLEKFFEKRIDLRLWVKISKNWSDDEKALTHLGFQ